MFANRYRVMNLAQGKRYLSEGHRVRQGVLALLNKLLVLLPEVYVFVIKIEVLFKKATA